MLVSRSFVAKKRTELDAQELFGKKESLTTEKALQQYIDSMSNSGEYINISTRVNKLLGLKRNQFKEVIEIHGLDGGKPFE
jgi:hypothetical protein